MRRILVIDDHTASLELAVQILRLHGFSTLAARDGQEGLEKARTELPDLIVCDIRMSQMNGYELAYHLKSETSTRNIPLIAMTGIAKLANRSEMVLAGERLLLSGFDGYIPKPIDPVFFIRCVSSLIGAGDWPTRPVKATATRQLDYYSNSATGELTDLRIGTKLDIHSVRHW